MPLILPVCAAVFACCVSIARADQIAATWHARGADTSRAQDQFVSRAASRSAQSGKQSLAWRAPGASLAPAPATEVPEEPASEPPRAVTRAQAIDASAEAAPKIEQPSRRQPARLAPAPARRMPVPSSRSKTRDAVMQVSTDVDDVIQQSSGVKTGADEQNTLPALELPEAAPRDKPRGASALDDSDPFPDEKVPKRLDADEMPDEPSTSDLPPLDEPSQPVEQPPREPLVDPEDALERQQPSMEEPDSTVPDVEVPITPETDISCAKEKQECEKAIETLRGRDIRKIIVGIQIEGEGGKPAIEGRDYPCECALGLRTTFQGRHWAPVTFTWKASSQCHKPLYFEDVQLERYGHAWNPVLQPFMSAAHFFVSVPLLPYKMGLTPPAECMYTLGYYRPGDCAPYMIEPLPLSLRAGAFQAIGITGFAFWFWPPVTGPAALVRAQ